VGKLQSCYVLCPPLLFVGGRWPLLSPGGWAGITKQQTEECTQDRGGVTCPPPPRPTSVKPVTKLGSRLMRSVPTMLITRLDCLLKHSKSTDFLVNSRFFSATECQLRCTVQCITTGHTHTIHFPCGVVLPILHTWFRDGHFTCDGSSTRQVFPFLFYIGMVI
jgi:hypothetical protein